MSVSCECCVLSRRDLCDEPIPRPEEFYRLWHVMMCDLETSRTRRRWAVAPGERKTRILEKNARKNRKCSHLAVLTSCILILSMRSRKCGFLTSCRSFCVLELTSTLHIYGAVFFLLDVPSSHHPLRLFVFRTYSFIHIFVYNGKAPDGRTPVRSHPGGKEEPEGACVP